MSRTNIRRLNWLDSFLGDGGEVTLADDGINVELWKVHQGSVTAPTLREAIDKAMDEEEK